LRRAINARQYAAASALREDVFDEMTARLAICRRLRCRVQARRLSLLLRVALCRYAMRVTPSCWRARVAATRYLMPRHAYIGLLIINVYDIIDYFTYIDYFVLPPRCCRLLPSPLCHEYATCRFCLPF